MKRLILFLFACAIMCDRPAGAVEYWPIEGNCTYVYENAEGEVLSVWWYLFEGGHGGRHCVFRGHNGAEWATYEVFANVGYGVLELQFYQYSEDLTSDPTLRAYYTPDLQFLKLPLEIGKSWTTAGRVSLYEHQHAYLDFQQHYIVDRFETVSVPIGTFEVVVIVESDLLSTTHHSGTYYLDRDIGAVILPGGFELVSIDRSTPVESQSWGHLKALFR